MERLEFSYETLHKMLSIKNELSYPLILRFQGKETTIKNCKELEDKLKEYESLCNNKLNDSITNTREDLLR